MLFGVRKKRGKKKVSFVMGPGNKMGSTLCNFDLTGQYKQSPTLSSSHREECLSLEW